VIVCPRCNSPGYQTVKVIRGTPYIYVIHKDSKNGRIARTCYIGPAESYRHAEDRLQLGLTNPAEIDYLEVASRALARYARLKARHSGVSIERALREALEELRARLGEALEEELEEEHQNTQH